MEIGKIKECSFKFEIDDGRKGTVVIPKILNGSVNIIYDYGSPTIDLSFDVLPDPDTKELFRIEMENDKESEEKMDKMKMNYTVVSCIFPCDKDKYYSDSKVYNYIIDGPPDNCPIKKNILFQVFDKQHKVKKWRA